MSANGALTPAPHPGLAAPWQKGQSGNPGGISKAKREVRTLARENCKRAMETIIALMDCDVPAVQLAAAIEIKNTAIGRPRIRDLTREEIEAEVDKRIRELAVQANAMKRAGALDVTPVQK